MATQTLAAVVDAVRDRERTIRVYAPAGDPAVEALGEYFASRNVRVEHVVGEPVRAEVVADGTVLGSVEEGALRALTAPPEAPSDERPGLSLVEYLDGTTFTSYDREQMLRASREIEDRAWRVGSGTLHAGFQRRTAFEAQLGAYRELGALSGLSVHVHLPEGPAPEGPFAVHADGADAEQTWFVVFDGGGDDHQKSALLAVEGDPGEFEGAWTYDPAVVDEVLAVVASA